MYSQLISEPKCIYANSTDERLGLNARDSSLSGEIIRIILSIFDSSISKNKSLFHYRPIILSP